MMDKQEMGENISALVDGELDARDLDALLLAVKQDEQAQQAWDTYHQIGAAMRAEELPEPSTAFAVRMAARLAAEAPLQASVAKETQFEQEKSQVQKMQHWWTRKKIAFGAALAAGLAALGMVGGPQMMLALNEETPAPNAAPAPMLASNKPITLLAGSNSHAPAAAAGVEHKKNVIADGQPQEMVILRDPQIDQYLLAHQRFSPSVYSGAQYARSATFATEEKKK